LLLLFNGCLRIAFRTHSDTAFLLDSGPFRGDFRTLNELIIVKTQDPVFTFDSESYKVYEKSPFNRLFRKLQALNPKKFLKREGRNAPSLL
jgi:hypothetical protein